MIHKIRTSKVSRIIACYLSIQLIVQMIQPMQLYALTSGPKQPEFTSFTPIGTSDMVDLSSGDFNYNIPIMDVGGYPLNLAYNSGVTMDQEASWVGLGWNLNVGQINRQVRGLPDDFKGDQMVYEKNLRNHVNVGVEAEVDPAVFGLELPDNIKPSVGLGLNYSNYHGISFKPSFGLSFELNDYVSTGINVQSSASEGATVTPNVSAGTNLGALYGLNISGALNAGVAFNTRQALPNINLGASLSATVTKDQDGAKVDNGASGSIASGSGSISFSSMTMTPQKRTAFINTNSTFSLSGGPDLWGFDIEGELSAVASVQRLKNKRKLEKAFGYEFTGHASKGDVLDYNRENDQEVSKSTLALPTANYTYDLYSVQGQGIGGMFRPHRSQIGAIHDEFVEDGSESFSLGGEYEGGTAWHVGANFTVASSTNYTDAWDTEAYNSFKTERESIPLENPDYEPVFFKYVGEPRVDNERSLYTDQLHGDKAMALKVLGDKSSRNFNREAVKTFRVKEYNNNNAPEYNNVSITAPKFKRSKREIRNQAVQKLTKSELMDNYTEEYHGKKINKHAKDHHTAEINVLQPDGSKYVFGEAAYNIEKHEVTFATESTGNCATGIVNYQSGENSTSNSAGIDNFFDRVTTPPYAHTYLLSAVLSTDYEDLSGNGPTDDDLGAYTKFTYDDEKAPDYQWRVPFYGASYNEGFKTNRADQKGNYLYGKKELKYIKEIETKTHIALFDLSIRRDGKGVKDQNGGLGSESASMYKLDKIRLYSKPEYRDFKEQYPDKEPTIAEVAPIKTANFEYSYSLCRAIENNDNMFYDGNGDGVDDNLGGKLTLKKVYFTYRNSVMGKYTPYSFDYRENDIDHNPNYSLKAYDVWGNYKPNEGGCGVNDGLTAPEFPFVQQEDRALQDKRAAAWSLATIGLPSGGKIDLSYESDDYQFVQDRETMQMFKVAGAGDYPATNSHDPRNNQLYSSSKDFRCLYVKLPGENNLLTPEALKSKYFKGMEGKPIYFRFLLNMTKKSQDYDYVNGYFELDKRPQALGGVQPKTFTFNNEIYAAIPMQFGDREGRSDSDNINPLNANTNPISKAGWYFGRKYLNGIAYGLNQDYRSENAGTIAVKLIKSLGGILEYFSGPNGRLRNLKRAQKFIPKKSWIRLSNPKTYKLGGGVRVKQLVMSDNWDAMAPGSTGQTYGQTYDYSLEDGTTSGVATFEPNDSAENPFVEPFYNNGERLTAPREVSYLEKPFGKAFFPQSKVTYSRVTVKNLDREDITRHATGAVVNEFFTSKDYPTKVDYTDIENFYDSNQNDALKNIVNGLFGLPIDVTNKFTLSQGFLVHTNDMDGKMKKQMVYQEGMNTPISSVEYFYNTKLGDDGKLDNKLPVVHKNGQIKTQEIGVDYDVVTDFRKNYNRSSTRGANGNATTFIIPGIPPLIFTVVTGFPVNMQIENIAQSVITTKVVHTTAILKEKKATDLGSSVSTVNEAWDAETGQVLLTKTVNEFDDHYYSFNFPAYWAYQQMGQATKNLGISGVLKPSGKYFNFPNANTYFALGDEIIARYRNENGIANAIRLWVVEIDAAANKVLLMDRKGNIINDGGVGPSIATDVSFKIVRSGNRNLQTGNMASITLMKNPIRNAGGDLITALNSATFLQEVGGAIENNPRIINASAVEYDDFWNAQCENGLPSIPFASPTSDELADLTIDGYGFNPYRYNVRGEYRAKRSYAYLTERQSIAQGSSTEKRNTRKEGYFKDFSPYYGLNNGQWEQEGDANDKWTFASEVTQYSAFGAEIENKDALNRYSAAQYGYNFTLPVAVASNSRYRYMGGDGFEDYDYLNTKDGHFNYKEAVDLDGVGGLVISNDYAHTGNSSLLIPQGSVAELPVELIGQEPDDDDADADGIIDIKDNCPYTVNPGQSDYDGNDIGDACDDAVIPKITNIKYSGQFYCRTSHAVFQIEGRPNEVVRFALSAYVGDRICCLRAYVNGERYNLSGLEGNFIEGLTPITLDATGRANVQLEVKVDKGGKNKRNRVIFHLLYPGEGDSQLIEEPESPSVSIFIKAGGSCNSFNTPGAAPLFTSNEPR